MLRLWETVVTKLVPRRSGLAWEVLEQERRCRRGAYPVSPREGFGADENVGGVSGGGLGFGHGVNVRTATQSAGENDNIPVGATSQDPK